MDLWWSSWYQLVDVLENLVEFAVILDHWWNIGGTCWGIDETGGILLELGGILVEFGEILLELWVYGGACWCIGITGWSFYRWIY